VLDNNIEVCCDTEQKFFLKKAIDKKTLKAMRAF
jgi:hypothetical protein